MRVGEETLKDRESESGRKKCWRAKVYHGVLRCHVACPVHHATGETYTHANTYTITQHLDTYTYANTYTRLDTYTHNEHYWHAQWMHARVCVHIHRLCVHISHIHIYIYIHIYIIYIYIVCVCADFICIDIVCRKTNTGSLPFSPRT
jgi:hypothetical protein